MKVHGFALVQALFLMMFIMGIISFTMILNLQRGNNMTGEHLAVDAYTVLAPLLSQSAVMNGTPGSYQANMYFYYYPLAPSYVTQMVNEGLSDPQAPTCSVSGGVLTCPTNANLSIQVSYT